LSEQGSLIVRTYASKMLFPIENSNVFITQNINGKQNLVAYRKTDKNGKTQELYIDAPNFSNSQTSQYSGKIFSTVDIKIEKLGYNNVIIKDVQIFSERISIQNVEMIPSPENDLYNNYYDIYTISPQNL